MADLPQDVPVIPADGPHDVAERDDMPLPHDPQTIFLAGLFFLACMAVLYVARVVVLPVVLAIMLKLLMQPLVRLMERVRIPKAVGALVCVLLLLGLLGGLGTLVTRQATSAALLLPQAWPKLRADWNWLEEPIGALMETAQGLGLEDSIPTATELAARLNPGAMVGSLATGAGGLFGHLLETLLILFYLLVFGETFLLRVVEILPKFRDKREAVEMSDQVERDLSIYMLTITVINAVVGVVTGCLMWSFGIPGPTLWGVMAFCLNFIPILGPLMGVLVFVAVGVLSLGATWFALVPAAAYLAVHVLEGEMITPMLLARRFTLNPVAVMVGLVFWYWMWGIPGAILSVPLLAITKIVCDRIRPLRALGHLLEG